MFQSAQVCCPRSTDFNYGICRCGPFAFCIVAKSVCLSCMLTCSESLQI